MTSPTIGVTLLAELLLSLGVVIGVTVIAGILVALCAYWSES